MTTATTGRHGKPAVWRIPANGPQRLDRSKAELLMYGWHGEHVIDQGCCADMPADSPPNPWWNCDSFVAARIRGMHHTMYVVPMPYDKATGFQTYAVLDIIDDIGAVELREGFDGYHTALLFAAAQCASEMAHEMGR